MISGTVSIPSGYFRKMAFVDYNNWRTSLAREFFQNSIDARASVIDVKFDNETKTITITDNGCGMNLDIIQNKLLVLGGSAKESGSVGAFGKAKELLYFSWDNWTINTRDILVKGQSGTYTIEHIDNYIRGTVSSIDVTGCNTSVGDIRNSFIYVALKMHTTTKIIIDGVEYKNPEHRGRLVKQLPFGNLYANKSYTGNKSYMEVNIGGVWMFDKYVGGDTAKFVFELTKNSVDCLTSNRDGLQYEYSDQLMAIIKEIMINTTTLLKTQRTKIKQHIYGTGKISLQPMFVESLKLPTYQYNKTETLKAMMEHIQANNIDINTEILKIRIQNEKNVDTDRLKMFAYKPDFVLLFSDDQRSKVKYFMAQKRASLLASIWSEIVKQIFLDSEFFSNVEFTVGFNFDPESFASVEHNGDDIIVYINPLKIGENGGWSKHPTTNRFLLSEELKDNAIHEVSHLVNGADHNENFSCLMHKIRAKATLNHKIYSKIARMDA